MASSESALDPFFKGDGAAVTRTLLRVVILVLIAAAAVSARLFSVIRFESIIHEFDPWFNFRATYGLLSVRKVRRRGKADTGDQEILGPTWLLQILGLVR